MSTRNHLFFFASTILYGATILSAAEHQNASCEVTFIAGATMEKDFVGKATSRVCRVIYKTEESLQELDLDVEISWADVSTAHDKRDKRMREHFSQGGLGVVRGTARNISVTSLMKAGAERPVTIPIQLTMGGVTNQVNGLVTSPMLVTERDTTLEVDFKISQKAFGYDSITLLGFMSVRDEVIGQAIFRLPPDPAAPAAPSER